MVKNQLHSEPSQQSFTVAEIHEFHRLRRDLKVLRDCEHQVIDQLAKLKRDHSEVVEQIANIEGTLNASFAELWAAENLFSPDPEPLPVPESTFKGTGYVRRDDKDDLLCGILKDYRLANPEAQTVFYREVKDILAKRHLIHTKSITNFFGDLLSHYEVVGGNRNKAIVLPKE